MNRFALLVVMVVGAGLLGFNQSAHAVIDNETHSSTGCAHGNFDEGSGLCDCNAGYHRTGDNHCDANLPWDPVTSPTSPPHGGTGGGAPQGGGGATTAPRTNGPNSKGCDQCKYERTLCTDDADAAYTQCEHDIAENAANLCKSEQRGPDGTSYPNVVQGYDQVEPCLIHPVGNPLGCSLWTVKVRYTWNDDCYTAYMEGYRESSTAEWNDDWYSDQMKDCHGHHLDDYKKCNADHPCEAVLCKP